MSNNPVSSASGVNRLVDALSVHAEASPAWSADELAAMLAHQLASPIRADLQQLSGDLVARFDSLASADLTFAQLFTTPQPNPELFQLVKEFAKKSIGNQAPALPEELGVVLYYGCLSCAWLAHKIRIHSLDDQALAAGLAWALAQSWLQDSLRNVFSAHLAQLQPGAQRDA